MTFTLPLQFISANKMAYYCTPLWLDQFWYLRLLNEVEWARKSFFKLHGVCCKSPRVFLSSFCSASHALCQWQIRNFQHNCIPIYTVSPFFYRIWKWRLRQWLNKSFSSYHLLSFCSLVLCCLCVELRSYIVFYTLPHSNMWRTYDT